MQVVCVPLRLSSFQHLRSQGWCFTHGSNFQFGDLSQILLVVDTVAKYITKVAKSPLQSISSTFFLSFFECSSFPLAILDVTIANILWCCKCCTELIDVSVNIVAYLMEGAIS